MPFLQGFRKPQALRRGDPVVAVAPSSPFERESFEASLAILGKRYEVRYDEGIFARERYLAGADSRRLQELLAALTDQHTRAIFCARGGYGVTRLLAGLAAQLPLVHQPAHTAAKPLIGFSDLTALHGFLQSRQQVSIHGPVLTQLTRLPDATSERLFELLESAAAPATLTATATYCAGAAEGVLVGGNLSVLTRLLGTPFMPPLRGAILLLEDTGERPYRLDRMWTHLALAGVFRHIRGIALGEFFKCEEPQASYTSADVLASLAAETGLPCAAGFPIGHGALNEAVPLGVRVRLDADARTLSFLEGAVTPAAD